MLLGRYLQRPRHVEIQVLGDKHGNVIHLGERECSIQRRNQKFIEEAPSASISEQLRQDIARMAVDAAVRAGYRNVGTFEFLVDREGIIRFRLTGFSKAGLIRLSEEIARMANRPPAPVFLPSERVPETKPG